VVTSLSRPFFSGAINLKEFRLHSEGLSFLDRFVFPNLTSFELSVTSGEWFRGSQLLDFLEASSMLQVVDVKILTTLSLEGVPQERVAVLHNVESLCLTTSGGGSGHKIPIHISCPSVKNTSLTCVSEGGFHSVSPLAIFPASNSLNTIIRQYTRSSMEEVRLEVITDPDFIAFSITFRSADTTVLKFRLQVTEGDDASMSLSCDVFSKACRAIRDLPQLANVKHLHVYGLEVVWVPTMHIAHDFGGLLKSLGPLEELTIFNCDLRPFFSHYPEIVEYPSIRVLMLSDPRKTLNEDVVKRLVRLAKTQHEIGVPFEGVKVHSYIPPADLEEKLGPWVGVVNCALYDKYR